MSGEIAPTATVGVARTALEESGQKGEFVRKDAAWRNWIQKGSSTFKTKKKNRMKNGFMFFAKIWIGVCVHLCVCLCG